MFAVLAKDTGEHIELCDSNLRLKVEAASWKTGICTRACRKLSEPGEVLSYLMIQDVEV